MRSVGFDGLVSVHWRLNALSGIDDSNTTFNATSGVLSFASGAAHQNIYLQVCTALYCFLNLLSLAAKEELPAIDVNF